MSGSPTEMPDLVYKIHESTYKTISELLNIEI
jgi:hypothetical protein